MFSFRVSFERVESTEFAEDIFFSILLEIGAIVWSGMLCAA